jgi:succinate-semialdehyde dehydrogenase/glutarate-semialdehyde dehydrogenase
VQEKSYGDFVDAFEEAVKSVKVGNGMEEGVQMGPLVADRRLPVMQDFVDDAVANGATLVTGGKRIGNQGYFYEPTLLKDVPENAKIMNDEPFGPVAPVASFKTEEEIITRANKVKVGLASYAFTSDGERANRLGKKLNTGMVGINSMNVSTPESPFGGVDESGYGSEGGIEGLDAYLRTKLVSETGV